MSSYNVSCGIYVVHIQPTYLVTNTRCFDNAYYTIATRKAIYFNRSCTPPLISGIFAIRCLPRILTGEYDRSNVRNTASILLRMTHGAIP